jgi:hypothetical protein
MKKMIFGGIAVLVIAATVALNMYKGSQSNDLSEMALANIEALARQEDPNAEKSYDYSFGSLGSCHILINGAEVPARTVSCWRGNTYVHCARCAT